MVGLDLELAIIFLKYAQFELVLSSKFVVQGIASDPR
jgi:hypothetical protein